MHVVAIGLNHRTAPVEVRERVAFSPAQVGDLLQQFLGSNAASEVVILSTCNRTEVYLVADATDKSLEATTKFLGSCYRGDGLALPQDSKRPRADARADEVDLARHLYHRVDQHCVDHLFRVASGIDSMVVGESQILAQVKQAFDTARTESATSVILDELFRRALRVGKRARTETEIGSGALSVGSAAVELAKTIFGQLHGRTVLILGAGKMSELTSKHLVDNGANRVLVANRSHERAVELAQRFNGEAIRYDLFPEYLKSVDIVISSTSAPHFVVRADTVSQVMRSRRERPLFLIDIAVPRDIDPEANRLDNVFLYDIDDLQSVVATNRTERDQEVHRVESIVEREVRDFTRWFQSLDVQPVIAALALKAEQIREREVERALSRLSHLSPRDREVVQALGKGISQKIIHEPIVRLRESAESGNGYVAAEVVRRIFNLDRSEEHERVEDGE